jgi:hypothetical protein
VEEQLLGALGDWLLVIRERFRRRADPTQAIGSAADRLAARLARLEARIDETFARAGEGVLSAGRDLAVIGFDISPKPSAIGRR